MEFDDSNIVVEAAAVTAYGNTSANGTAMVLNNSIPTMAPTLAPTPVPQVRVEIQFEAMLRLDGGLGAAAYEYLNNEMDSLMADIKGAALSLTQVYNTSVGIEACCFRWQGGGISAVPVFRVVGSLADDLGSKWGPHEVPNGGEVTSSMQVKAIGMIRGIDRVFLRALHNRLCDMHIYECVMCEISD
jgi:hypothetical protein